MTDHHHPESQVPERDRPTPAQMRYLRSLARRTGQSFAWPKTKAQASREIKRLTSVSAGGRGGELYRALSSSDELPSFNATAIREDEITGYGATARWA